MSHSQKKDIPKTGSHQFLMAHSHASTHKYYIATPALTDAQDS